MGCSKVAVKKEPSLYEDPFYPYIWGFTVVLPLYLAPPARLERATN